MSAYGLKRISNVIDIFFDPGNKPLSENQKSWTWTNYLEPIYDLTKFLNCHIFWTAVV